MKKLITIDFDGKTIELRDPPTPPGWTPWSRVHANDTPVPYGIEVEANGVTVAELYEYVSHHTREANKGDTPSEGVIRIIK